MTEITSLLELPPHWEWMKLKDCVEILDNHRVPINSSERNDRITGKDPSELYPYYGATGQIGWIDDYLFGEELVLLGEDGAPFLDPYKPKAYIIKGKTWVNNHAHVLKAKKHILLNSFLLHYLNIFDYRDYITGTTRYKLNQTRMKEIPIPIPPITEQHLIVEKIEKLFTKLDYGVNLLKNIKAQLNQYFQSVLKYAIEGNLTKEWREVNFNESNSIILDKIHQEWRKKWENIQLSKKRKKGLIPKNENWKKKYKTLELVNEKCLPELPMGWFYSYLNSLLSLKRVGLKTGPFGTQLKKNEHQETGVPVIGIENISSMKFVHGSKIHITKEKADFLSNYNILPGDIILSRSGTIDQMCVIPNGLTEARISTNIIRITLNEKIIKPQFFCYLFSGSPYIKNQMKELCKGSIRLFINQKILKSLIFPIPPVNEQERIIEKLEEILTRIENIQNFILKNINKSSNLYQSILNKAFEGRLLNNTIVKNEDEILKIKQIKLDDYV